LIELDRGSFTTIVNHKTNQSREVGQSKEEEEEEQEEEEEGRRTGLGGKDEGTKS